MRFFSLGAVKRNYERTDGLDWGGKVWQTPWRGTVSLHGTRYSMPTAQGRRLLSVEQRNSKDSHKSGILLFSLLPVDRGHLKAVVPRFSTSFLKNSIRYRGAVLWNFVSRYFNNATNHKQFCKKARIDPIFKT